MPVLKIADLRVVPSYFQTTSKANWELPGSGESQLEQSLRTVYDLAPNDVYRSLRDSDIDLGTTDWEQAAINAVNNLTPVMRDRAQAQTGNSNLDITLDRVVIAYIPISNTAHEVLVWIVPSDSQTIQVNLRDKDGNPYTRNAYMGMVIRIELFSTIRMKKSVTGIKRANNRGRQQKRK